VLAPRKRRRTVSDDPPTPPQELSESVTFTDVDQPDVKRAYTDRTQQCFCVDASYSEGEEDVTATVAEIDQCYQDYVDAVRSRPKYCMLSDMEYSDFDESDEDEEWAEYRQSFWDYMEESVQPDFHVVTDEEELDIADREVEVSPLRQPVDVFQLESSAEVNSPNLPPLTPSRDVLIESAESDLTRFTPDQVARIWSATMQMQREVYTTYQSRHEQQLQQEQLRFSEVELTRPASIQHSPTQPQDNPDRSAQFIAPSLTTGPSQSDFDQAHVPAIVSIAPHTCVYGPSLVSTSSPHAPHSSSRHSFSEGVRTNTQLLGGAAVVNNIYVPPPRALSSAVSRQVSAIIRRPVITPRVVLDPRAPSFQPRVTQLDSTTSVHSSPAASLGVIVDSLSNTDSALPSTTFTPSMHQSVPYTHPEPDEPKPSDIIHSKSSACAPELSAVTDAPIIGEDPEVPEHLRELFDETVERSQLSPSNQQYLAEVLRRNSSAFATGPMDIGFCDAIQHDIETGDAKPIKQPPRRPPLAARDEKDKQLDEMLETGVIEPSYSPWRSPVCMAKKKDGSFRFCIDYRRLNAVTEKDAYPVPHVKDALDSFHGAKYFATIDLLSGYWQIGMTERAKHCSAFCTRRGLFQWTRMPFGLTNAPSTFCRLMENIFHDLLYNICICYLDDINVYAATPEQLIDHLNKVFTRLRDHGLKAKPSKCIFFKSPIEFLGHLVSADGIEPQPDKVEKIENWPVPRCLREVRAFAGLASYYRRFIKHFATLAEPLTSLMQGKSKPFVWTDEAQEAFEKLKQALFDIVTLAYPIPELPCIMDTDASDVAVGAVLSQKIDGVEKPIAFYSAVLNRTQRNYCATRREMLAVVKSLQHFCHYLLGAKVILRMDHHSLLWLRMYKNPTGIMARWIETMAEFDIEIQHRSGRLHSNADALSRHSCKQCYDKKMPSVWIDECERAEEILEPLSVRAFRFLPELTSSDVAAMQAEDSDIGPAYAVLSENTDPSPDEIRAFPYESKMLLSHRPEVRLVDDVLVRQTDEQLQLVVPTQLRRRLFDLTHAGPSAAHLGAARTIIQLKTHYYWVGLNRDVRQWCRQCAQCARAKGAPLRPTSYK